MTIDLLPTLARFADAPLPPLPIDGKDISRLFLGEAGAKSPHQAYFFYYNTGELQAVRAGRWKLILPHTYRTMQGQEPGRDGKPGRYRQVKVELSLFDLEQDVGETRDVAAEHPAVIAKLMEYVEAARADLGDSLTKRQGKGVREPGRLQDAQ